MLSQLLNDHSLTTNAYPDWPHTAGCATVKLLVRYRLVRVFSLLWLLCLAFGHAVNGSAKSSGDAEPRVDSEPLWIPLPHCVAKPVVNLGGRLLARTPQSQYALRRHALTSLGVSWSPKGLNMPDAEYRECDLDDCTRRMRKVRTGRGGIMLSKQQMLGDVTCEARRRGPRRRTGPSHSSGLDFSESR